MSCKVYNCFNEDDIQDILNKVSNITGLCFPSIGTTFISADTEFTSGFLLTNTGGFLLQSGGLGKFIISFPNVESTDAVVF